ncbi:DMT family transporter [Rehaibacterium terrae]|jgi:drug/metabolite transporter (DMT)-like permease|uniref:Drug/metabolite transporter (DMT)-like permease n=1 Tax=Rehaibacterium terrae TaxID=1341696 RepID=A0A7W7V6Q9_9GAMM|nr:DMT family transporter [Rehaibacterium terrae]MBB5014162.1 drug/metabolite transporter (DMT)-like permease [Rehaibacterium terrae]
MALHQASGRWKLGLALALATAGFWSTLPVALKITLEQLDPYTLTWFRFLVAFVLMFAWLAARGGLAPLRGLTHRHRALLAVAALGLIGNYVFYLLGVQHTSPGNAQLLIQLAPLLMALGGIFVFRERFATGQWLGLAVIVGGLALFFADQLGHDTLPAGRYVWGSTLVIAAAVVWAVYALAQKQLLLRLSSPLILLVIYAAASLLLWPLARPTALLQLDALHWGLLVYCALNTLGAYGCFAEALAHWEASRVSAILATTPLLCIGVVFLVHALWPTLIRPEAISWLGFAGAGLVVLGSTLTSLLGQRKAA